MDKSTRPATPTRWILPSLLAGAALFVGASTASGASLMESVQSALDTNPDVGIVKADRHAVDQELRQARGGYLPQVDVRAAAGPEYTQNSRFRAAGRDSDKTLFRSEAQLTLSQMLFDGYSTPAEVARQRARVDSAAYRVSEAAEFVGLNAIEAHYEVLRNQEIVSLNEANVRQHEGYLGQVGELERSGQGEISQVRQTEARLGRSRESLAVARGQLADAIANYRRIVGVRPGKLDDPEAPPAALPASAEAASELASYSNPTVKISASDVDVAEAELKAAKAGYYPNLDLQLGASAGDNLDGVEQDVYDASALVVMRYNLFRGGADVALEREAFHRLNEARASLLNARRDAEQEARISYNALETARARASTLRDQAEAQRRTRDAYASQFDIGQRELLDLLDSENEYFLDRVSLVTADYTEEFAAYRVLAVIGELLDALDVGKPREAIDLYRRPGDVQTPERIENKSDPLRAPKAEPRYLRQEAAGEPPANDRDAGPHVGREGEAPKRGVFLEPEASSAGGRRTLFDYFRSPANPPAPAAPDAG